MSKMVFTVRNRTPTKKQSYSKSRQIEEIQKMAALVLLLNDGKDIKIVEEHKNVK